MKFCQIGPERYLNIASIRVVTFILDHEPALELRSVIDSLPTP
jgi:hypothetical protein